MPTPDAKRIPWMGLTALAVVLVLVALIGYQLGKRVTRKAAT